MHFNHLVDFDCMIWVEKRWSDISNIGQQIIASFSQFSAWSIHVSKELVVPYICVFTKTLKLSEVAMDHSTLRNLNTHQIATPSRTSFGLRLRNMNILSKNVKRYGHILRQDLWAHYNSRT